MSLQKTSSLLGIVILLTYVLYGLFSTICVRLISMQVLFHNAYCIIALDEGLIVMEECEMHPPMNRPVPISHKVLR